MPYRYNPFTGNLDSVVVSSVPETFANQFDADSGSATPANNVLTIIGNGGITTSAAGSTITINGNSESILPITQVVGSGNTYTVLTTDYYLSCDVSGGTLQVNLPNAPTTGSVWVVKDAGGDANTNNITVTTPGASVTIDGSTTFVMNTNYESANFVFNATSYEVF